MLANALCQPGSRTEPHGSGCACGSCHQVVQLFGEPQISQSAEPRAGVALVLVRPAELENIAGDAARAACGAELADKIYINRPLAALYDFPDLLAAEIARTAAIAHPDRVVVTPIESNRANLATREKAEHLIRALQRYEISTVLADPVRLTRMHTDAKLACVDHRENTLPDDQLRRLRNAGGPLILSQDVRESYRRTNELYGLELGGFFEKKLELLRSSRIQLRRLVLHCGLDSESGCGAVAQMRGLGLRMDSIVDVVNRARWGRDEQHELMSWDNQLLLRVMQPGQDPITVNTDDYSAWHEFLQTTATLVNH